jgi:hypothetical protein
MKTVKELTALLWRRPDGTEALRDWAIKKLGRHWIVSAPLPDFPSLRRRD